jgi:hypothetical protein
VLVATAAGDANLLMALDGRCTATGTRQSMAVEGDLSIHTSPGGELESPAGEHGVLNWSRVESDVQMLCCFIQKIRPRESGSS